MPAESTSVAMPHRSIAVFLERKQSRAQGSQYITDNALASRWASPTQPLLPSSMPRRIRLHVSQNRPMKPAVTINSSQKQAPKQSAIDDLSSVIVEDGLG